MSRDSVITYLSSRCDESFLRAYLQADPELTQHVATNPYSNARMLARLHEYGLLPEQARIEILRELSQEGRDEFRLGYLNDPNIKTLMTEQDIEIELNRIREGVLPDLESIIASAESKFSSYSDYDLDTYLDEYVQSMDVLIYHFEGDPDVGNLVLEASSELADIRDRLAAELPVEPDSDDWRASSRPTFNGLGIFADVDE